MIKDLKERLIELSTDGSDAASFEMEKLLEEAIKNDPQNPELLLKLAILEFDMPFLDDEKCIASIQKIFEYDPHNATALILLAYMNYHFFRMIDKSLFDRLNSLKTGNNETDSLLKYAATWYYAHDCYEPASRDITNQVEKLLLESIKKCQSHVHNYEELACMYLHQNRYDEALTAIRHAIQNVVKIYGEDIEKRDDTDVQKFFNYYITGIDIMGWAYKELKALEREIIIRNKLIQDPLNIDLLLRLSIIEIMKFSSDYEERIISLEKILALDPDNIYALLILAYVMYYRKKSVEESLFQKLIAIKTSDPELNSLLLYAASWFYEGKDDKKQEELLRESIAAFGGHSKHYAELAHLCFKQNKIDEAKSLMKQSLNNVAKVFSRQAEADFTSDVEFFINQALKGIYRSRSSFDSLKKRYDS